MNAGYNVNMSGLPTGTLDRVAIAKRLGITPNSWSAYVARGSAPRPDGYVDVCGWWHEQTIEHWLANRPGRGAGGGRPWPKKLDGQA